LRAAKPACDKGAGATETTMAKTELDIGRLIDTRPICALQYRVYFLCALVAVLDAVDSQSIGVAAPLMAADLHISPGGFAPAFSAGLFGATIGAFSFGSVADVLGRRPMLIAMTALFGACTCLTAFATGFPTLLLYRFVAGLALGGATPSFITLAAEYAPSRRRAMLVSLLWAGYPLGNAAGGFMTSFLVAHFRWPMLFYAGGVPSLIVALLLALLMPESVRWLASKGQAARAAGLAERLDPSLRGTEFRPLAPRQAPTRRVPLRELFSDGRALGTVLVWFILYLGFASTTVISLQTPTLLHASGIPLSTAASFVGIEGLSAAIGMAIAGRLVEKFGPVVALVPAFVMGGALLVGLGYFSSSVVLAGLVMTLLGLTVPLGTSGAIALAATFYPTAIRSSGVGWAMGMGRFGQVCSPLVIGLMLSLGWPPAKILAVMAAAPLAAALCVLLRTWLTRTFAPTALAQESPM
jgi:MFS transporter, AAHS family, 4-hydroxybenzoate transporter